MGIDAAPGEKPLNHANLLIGRAVTGLQQSNLPVAPHVIKTAHRFFCNVSGLRPQGASTAIISGFFPRACMTTNLI
jgi:hypothetical protein